MSVGANVQPGQVVQISADVMRVNVARAVADAAYRRGARFVIFDLHDAMLRRSLIVHGPGDAYVPGWREASIYGLDEIAGAKIEIAGPIPAGLFDGLDAGRIDRSQPPHASAWAEVEYRVNNTIIPGPDLAWARALHPDLDASAAMDLLWDEIAIALRLDEPDPSDAWRARFAELDGRAERLTNLGLTALSLRGPGTDLDVGLLPNARWEPPTNRNERGVLYAWNLPSEEVFTSPDPGRIDGYVSLTRPAVLSDTQINDARLTFAAGELTRIEGGPGIERLRAFAARDPGTRRVGEIALVDADSAVAKITHPFGAVLLDENAASHLALGFGFPEMLPDGQRHRVNSSEHHLDLTIGSTDLDVMGITATGQTVRLMSHGEWASNIVAR